MTTPPSGHTPQYAHTADADYLRRMIHDALFPHMFMDGRDKEWLDEIANALRTSLLKELTRLQQEHGEMVEALRDLLAEAIHWPEAASPRELKARALLQKIKGEETAR